LTFSRQLYTISSEDANRLPDYFRRPSIADKI